MKGRQIDCLQRRSMLLGAGRLECTSKILCWIALGPSCGNCEPEDLPQSLEETLCELNGAAVLNRSTAESTSGGSID
jgi:hypothetical protein